MELKSDQQVSIVGGGPAGISCALMLKRYGIDAIIYEREALGGLLINAWRVENFPPLPPMSGEELVSEFARLVSENGITVVFDDILEVHEDYLVGARGTYPCGHVVIATGTEPRRLPEFEISEHVVYEFKHLPSSAANLAIYGGGDVAFDSTLKARERGMMVKVFVRSNRLKAVPKLVSYAQELGVHVVTNAPIRRVEQDNQGILIYYGTHEVRSERFDALLLALGRKAVTPKIFKHHDLYFAGDVAHEEFRQASIAVGDGVRVAMEITRSVGG